MALSPELKNMISGARDAVCIARFEHLEMIGREIEELPDALSAVRPVPLELQAEAIALRSRLAGVKHISNKEMTAADLLVWQMEANNIELGWIDLKHRAEKHLQKDSGPMASV